MIHRSRSLLVLAACIALTPALSARADEAQPTAEQLEFFEKKVRPILAENCHKCHGEKKQQGNLRLDSKAAILAGGDLGTVVVPGKPEESLLVEAINYKSLEMPPDARLKPELVAILTEWVKMGAPWPGGSDAALQPRKGPLEITDADRQFWSFRPIANPPLPAERVQGSGFRVQDREVRGQRSEVGRSAPEPSRNSIDAFIRHKLAEKQLAPSPPASPRELLRRLSIDLTGLPPTYEEIEEFAADQSPDALERRADRLLASPRHGERWGRHWLDIVRYAQTNGYERDDEKPNAWRYRDYVIRALNADKPYDRFLIEQLAGDELAPPTDDSIAATAYYRLGVWDDEPDDPRQADADELDDIVSATGSAMLGLTIGCARCHDHKFDPIAQEDYYSFTGFFANIHRYGKMAETVGGGQPVNKEGVFRELPSGGGQTLCVSERMDPPKPTHILIRGDAGSPGKQVQPRYVEVLCSSKEAAFPKLPETGTEPPTEGTPRSLPATHGRRTTLARWIVSAENPLAARVIVNRLWHYHFGRGIVVTPSDFGHTGQPPSHPELLDHLASELIRGNWELKRLHRRMVSSATYRQSSRAEGSGFRVQGLEAGGQKSEVRSQESAGLAAAANPQLEDPDNTLLWRQNLRRMEAEAIRDATLSAAGSLNVQMYGRGIFPTLSAEVLSSQSRPGSGWENNQPPAQQARRSVYIFVKRTLGVPLLESFDAASPDTPTSRRNVTTVAPQALILLNGEFLEQQAAALAERIARESPGDASAQIVRAYQLALGRLPSDSERQIAAGYLAREQARWLQLEKDRPDLFAAAGNADGTKLAGWQQYGGKWQLREDGGLQVDATQGAKIVHEKLEVGDGTVEAQVMLLEGGGDAGLVLRVNQAASGVDALHAYNINLKKDQLRLGKHQNDWRALATSAMELAPRQWHDVKVVLEGARIRIFVGGAKEPQIDYTDEMPLPPGKIGFRTYAISSAVRNLRLQTGERTAELDFKSSGSSFVSSTPASQRALAALCKLVLNLNEFVYVD
jgi:cytochrome c553